MERTIVLNSNYEFLSFCNWKRALNLVNSGKAEVVKPSNRIIKNFSGTYEFAIPYIIKLVKLIRAVYKRKIPWSKKNVFIRDLYTCQYCGVKVSKPELEHVIPKSRGGKNSFENCVTSCTECNRKKGDKLPSEVGMFLKCQPSAPTINEYLLKIGKINNIQTILEELFNSFNKKQ